MKVLHLFLILAFIFLTNCVSPIESSLPPTSNVNDANIRQQIQYEANKIDNTKREKLDVQNEKFRQVPDEFKNVDFKNFKYPIAQLKNGEYEEIDEKHNGGTTYYFDDVFYSDLNNDGASEAIIMLYAVSCGGSCDGGRSIIYFYSARNGQPKLIDTLEMGSRSSGCSLKSFAVKDKKIFVEQFGNCKEKSTFNKDELPSCKFCVKNLTRSVYHFEKNYKLVRDTVEEIETPETNVMNYSAEISIDD